MALNFDEAKYMTANITSFESIWLHKFIVELTSEILEPMVVCYDNQNCIKLSENLVIRYCSKHFEIKYHFLKHKVYKWAIALEYIQTAQQVADILTKLLGKGEIQED